MRNNTTQLSVDTTQLSTGQIHWIYRFVDLAGLEEESK
jgi:hypothetical protein